MSASRRHQSPYPGPRDLRDPARPRAEADGGPAADFAVRPVGARRVTGALLPAMLGGLVVLGGLALSGRLDAPETRVVTVPASLGDRDGAAADGASQPDGAARAARAAEDSRPTLGVPQIVQGASPAVVQVEVDSGRSIQSGTGFLIDAGGTALTNEHVVEDADTVTVQFSDRSTSSAKVVGTDPDTDLAVLDIAKVPAGVEPLVFGRSGTLVVGEPVVAIGNPFGFARTATTGIVSALERLIDSQGDFPISNAIQTDAAINKGNSGGPLIDARGRVVGINTQIFSQGGGSDGVGFAVPIDTVRPVARAILTTGRAQHAWLGITGRAVTPEMATSLGIADRRGVVVVGVDDRGPSAAAGLKAAQNPEAEVPRGGDIIVRAGERTVEGMDDVSQEVSSRAVGDRLALRVLRDGRERTLTVSLADRPAGLGASG